MVEETPEKWQQTVAKAVAMEPDSVTIYQMEVPYNTGIYRQMKAEGSWWHPLLTGTPNGVGWMRRSEPSRREATP